MYLETQKILTVHERPSKLGNTHSYSRIKTLAVFKCDNCDSEFTRELSKMDHKRLNNHYFHVCQHCDSKKFAQKIGVERRRVWDINANSSLDISRI